VTLVGVTQFFFRQAFFRNCDEADQAETAESVSSFFLKEFCWQQMPVWR